MKEILQEVYRTTKKVTGVDPSKPGNLKQVLVNDDAFEAYVTGLAESIENKNDRKGFVTLAENTRINLLENSMFQINPYETLALPILRVFYPKLVAKEAVTVSPMDKPESVKAFITSTFSPANSSNNYAAPSINQDISGGPSVGTPVTATMNIPQSAFDVLAVAGVTSTQAHLERDFNITAVSDGTTWTNVNIVPAVEGHFSSSVTLGAGTDVLSGQVDYFHVRAGQGFLNKHLEPEPETRAGMIGKAQSRAAACYHNPESVAAFFKVKGRLVWRQLVSYGFETVLL